MAETRPNESNLSQYFYDEQTKNLYELVSKNPSKYDEIQNAKRQIEKLIEKHVNEENQQIQELAPENWQRLEKINRLANRQYKKHTDFKYYYDKSTKLLTQAIRNKRLESDLYANRQKVISLFKEITVSQIVADKEQKLHKLEKLLGQVDRRIEEKEQKHIMPISLANKAQEAFTQYIREINFFLIAAWIISFLLANSDPSQCLDEPIDNLTMTFRTWLWTNGAITLYFSVMLVLFFTLTSLSTHDDTDDSDSENQFEDQDNTHLGKSPNKQSQHKQQTKIKISHLKSKYKKQNQLQYTLCDKIIICMALLGLIGKLFWIFFGIVLFLNNVNFNHCEDNVLNYCSLEFLAFFSFTIYGAIVLFLSLVKKFAKRQHKFYPTENQLEMNQNQKMSMRQKEEVRQEIRFYVEGNIDDLQDILKRVVVWTLIGWVYDFVLYRKDDSECLKEEYGNFNLTYKKWLLIDGIASVVTFAFAIIMIVIFILKREHFMIWQYKKEFFYINMNWVRNNLWMSIIFGLILVFKVAWLIIGIIIFCANVKLKDCSGNIPNFLVAYFTESVYVIIEAGICAIKGYKRKRKISKVIGFKLDESQADLLEDNIQQNHTQNPKRNQTIPSKNLLRQDTIEIKSIVVSPQKTGSQKRLYETR